MTMYLISTARKHSTVAHLVAHDGIHALCTYEKRYETWPRVGGQVAGGEWVTSEGPGDRMICKNCKRKARPDSPLRPISEMKQRERKRAEELDRLRKWNEAAVKQ